MNTQQSEAKIDLQTPFEVAVGYEVKNMLNLKFNKIGRTPTTWGDKTIQGLGASVLRIVEQETERKNENTPVSDSSKYYADQLKNIEVGKTQYAPTIKVFANDNGSDTKHMDLNAESAAVLIEWLKNNFIK